MEALDWLAVIKQEYLDDFVRQGGAAVKCIVPADEAGRVSIREGLRAAAAEGGYQFGTLDATEVKVHLFDHLFHAIARQVDWESLAGSFLRRCLPALGINLPEDDGRRGRLTFAAIAAVNDLPEPILHGELKRGVTNQLYYDYTMCREFRLAMLRLCLAQLDPTDDPSLTDAVLEWLRGDLRLISALKRALIFQRIARHNARHMLVSLTRWLRLAGMSGLVLVLDIARYGDATRPIDRGPGLYYSAAACIDLYEVLRQLIDAADQLESCFVGVVAGPAFLVDERRGVQRYQALYLRIADEVRDRNRPNPRAALVRLDSEATTVAAPTT